MECNVTQQGDYKIAFADAKKWERSKYKMDEYSSEFPLDNPHEHLNDIHRLSIVCKTATQTKELVEWIQTD